MKEIILVNNRGKVLVDDEDFSRMNSVKWYLIARGNLSHAYRKIGKTTVYFHRELLGVTDPNIVVDHKDFNGLNNKRDNLRSGPKAFNQRNQRKVKKGTSQYKGVCWNRTYKKWQVEITFNYKRVTVGYFDDEEEAAIAYDDKALELFGDSAYLNIRQRKP